MRILCWLGWHRPYWWLTRHHTNVCRVCGRIY